MADDSPAPPILPGVVEPVSPSKRRKSENHYVEGDSSPSKKRATQSKENEDFEGRGMLFGVDPSTKTAEEDFDLGEVEEKPQPAPPKSKGTLPRIKLVGPGAKATARRGTGR